MWELLGGQGGKTASEPGPRGASWYELEQTVGMETGFWGQRQVEETRKLSVGILVGHWEKWSGVSSQVVARDGRAQS